MVTSLYSPSWYRVANLRPRLRAHAQTHRQRFRGAIWYILQDHQTGRFHRLSPAAHQVICLMDGRRTVEQIWTIVSGRLGEDQPTQEEIVRLLAQLHGADLLIGEVPPLSEEMSERSDREARRALLMKIRNPLALRFPLLDPDRFLARTLPLVRPLFTVWGFLAWLALVATGIVLAAMNWPALTGDLLDQILTAQNVAIVLCTYPIIKAVHELCHAYATKVWGGEVHEMGVMLLVLAPIPYVDASSSSAFREKWRRIVVGSAGILAETTLAAIAMIVWVAVEPGLLRAVAFTILVVSGASTLLFNGNPLLRFDGYYVLCDLIEIPNLGARANKYFFYLVQRYGLGLTDVATPATASGERGWLLFYAIASCVYRLFIMLAIAMVIATKLFFVGVALALMAIAGTLVWPLLKGLKFLLTSPRLAKRRSYALAVAGGAAAVLAVALFVAPAPYATLAQGVVWAAEGSAVRVLSEGVVARIVAQPGELVGPGAKLIAIEEPILAAANAVLDHQRDELQLRLEAVRLSNLVQANLLREQISYLDGQIAAGRQRFDDLEIVAAKPGRFMVPDARDKPGRFVRRGDVLGYLIGDGDQVVRVVVPQADVDLVRRRTRKVEVRFVDRPDQSVPAQIVREVPAALAELPHLALATVGGGPVAVDPSQPDRPRPLEPLFHFDLAIPSEVAPGRLGGRVYVRFDHDPEPVALRVLRAARQLLLRQFSV